MNDVYLKVNINDFFSFHFVKICRMLCYYFKSFTKINTSMEVVLYTTQ